MRYAESISNVHARWGIAPDAVEWMAVMFARNIARRADSIRAGEHGATEMAGCEDWKRVRWVDPDTVWSVTQGKGSLGSGLGSFLAAPPTIRHISGDDAPEWAGLTLQRMAESVEILEGYGSGEVAGPMQATPVEEHMRDSISVLERVWRDQYLQVCALIRVFVYADCGSLRSGSDESTFGAIFVNRRKVHSTLDAFEILLHETAHHELLLRNMFMPYVTNGAELAEHPLRPDKRPVLGTVHACFVLSKMVAGLEKWGSQGPSAETEHIRERAASNRDKLKNTFAVLDRSAVWTAEGEAFYCDMKSKFDMR